MHRVIKFNLKAWLKSYIDMELRKSTKTDFEIDIFQSMNNAVFRKTKEIVGNHRDSKLEKIEARRNYLVSKPNYHTAKKFSYQTIIQKEMLMNKPVSLGLKILETTKVVMYEFY